MSDFFDRILVPQSASPNEGSPSPTGESGSGYPPAIPPTETLLTGTPANLKSAVQDLLRYGLIERDAKPNLYRSLAADPAAVARILEPFDLLQNVDDIRGIAFLAVPPQAATSTDDAWQHPLVRRQRLTTEQSLLIAILRQAHIAYEQQQGIGAAGARVDFDDLLAQFDLYLGDSGSENRNRERLLRVLGQLQAHGIVSEPDKDQQVFIRPIIVHLANPDHLQLLLHHFRQLAESRNTADPDSARAASETSTEGSAVDSTVVTSPDTEAATSE